MKASPSDNDSWIKGFGTGLHEPFHALTPAMSSIGRGQPSVLGARWGELADKVMTTGCFGPTAIDAWLSN